MVDNSISNSSIPVLPSQQGLILFEAILDCLEQMQALLLANLRDILDISSEPYLQQYFMALRDVIKMAIDDLGKERVTKE